jgi:glycosyltransferase involved in cell wall biosynthesis
MRSRDAELALADVVIVPSTFVRDSLALAPQPPRDIQVMPYGCPEPDVVAAHWRDASKPLKLLYVGTLGQGKGLADIDACLRLLSFPVDLTLIGSRQNGASCAALDSMLSRHRWLSGLSREQVMAEMREHDLLVLPTHYEGMALVVGEALSCGLPVITTTKAGAEPLIESQNSGFILPEGDAGALAAQIGVLHDHRDMLASLRQSALVSAIENNWGLYRKNLGSLVSTLFL